jgi:hypothetical protein
MATDLQDDGVKASGLVWSNQYGQLGTGPLLSRMDLPVGPNVITLKATNSLGLSAQTSITVVITDDDRPLGPTMTVAPSRVGLATGGASSPVVTGTLTVANTGSGDVTWSVTSDQPWLTASPVNGTAPSRLVVSVDPSTLALNAVTGGNLVFTAPGPEEGATQTITVPVTVETNPFGLAAHLGVGAPALQRQLYVPVSPSKYAGW